MKSRRRVIPALILLLTVAGGRALAQTQTPPPPPPPAPAQQTPPAAQQIAVPDLVTDLARIRAGLDRPPSFKVKQEGVRFYLTIIGERIDIHEYMRNSDLFHAPVPGAGVTHQDFINHITPKLLYSSGGITATELLQWNIVNWLGQMAVKKAFNKLGDVLQDAEIKRIREQIDRELAALRGK
jgi:hypothetical protein